MRLIDADITIKELNDKIAKLDAKQQIYMENGLTSIADSMARKIELCIECRELLEHQPTAYDVDKVLEQLEYKVKEYDERIEKRKGPTFFDETERIKQFDERAWGIEIAIEIVKGGGIDGNTNT
jgi:hypothetical protein|nr:MAG TPA: hypothetical protein [Caudoviricetes sp.]